MVPRGGVVNGKPLVCGGDSGLYLEEWHTSCSIWDKNTYSAYNFAYIFYALVRFYLLFGHEIFLCFFIV